MRLLTTNRFEKDLKRAIKRGKDLDKLWKIVEQLLNNKPLEKRHRPHPLSGNYATAWECHIEPDWLLIWNPEVDQLVLSRTGTHSDLF
ncbi:type II toxin-antitoxin system YafQ family toxin [bacterium]|jgi:mRNA interferase YafQ|nr:type II toxin-antitoxin system YafQ family toxin [bacterium]|tara:strand:+ start:135 stop:398 length:264 start_codon:yes stop_codon:yes gene_type:complete